MLSPLPRAVPRPRDGLSLQPLPLLFPRNRSIHQSRANSPGGEAIQFLCLIEIFKIKKRELLILIGIFEHDPSDVPEMQDLLKKMDDSGITRSHGISTLGFH